MASDRYRLAPLRDARERTEAVRRGDLGSAITDARASETVLAEIRARMQTVRATLATAVAERDTLLARGAGPTSLVRTERYLTRLRRDLAATIGEELRAEAAHDLRVGAIDLARGMLRRAHADRQVIERHFATWRETQRKLSERRDA